MATAAAEWLHSRLSRGAEGGQEAVEVVRVERDDAVSDDLSWVGKCPLFEGRDVRVAEAVSPLIRAVVCQP
jgi:hypothetical protein